MAMSIRTESPTGMNGVLPGQVRVTLTVDVEKINKSPCVAGLLEVVEQFEAPEPESAEA
jgi:hypothetical protein